MVTTVRQIYANATTSTDNAASIQFVKRGHITAMRMAVRFDAVADNTAYYAECSLFPTLQANVNDPNGPLITLADYNNLVTSGFINSGQSNSVSGISIPVEPGMKAYLNFGITGTLTINAIVQLYVTN